MSPSDPRHGERRGYLAGCRQDCCSVPHARYQKQSTLRRHRFGPVAVPVTDVVERINWWRQRGVTINALCAAAGLGEGTLIDMVHGERDICLPQTRRAVLAVTWDTLPDRSLINAAITRYRIDSMMAAGNTLQWICDQVDGLSYGGKWRVQAKISATIARQVRDLIVTAPSVGPSKVTASKARNRGALPPIGWDDPGTLAEPADWSPVAEVAQMFGKRDVDENVVIRVLAGESLPTTAAEKEEIGRRWRETGRPLAELARVTGWTKVERYGRGEVA